MGVSASGDLLVIRKAVLLPIRRYADTFPLRGQTAFNVKSSLVLELRIPIEQILTVTYTVAATAELRDRVRKRLRNALDDLRLGASEDDVVTKYLEGSNIQQGIRDLDLAVQNFDDARIFTIHAFCQRVLRDYAFESGMLFDTELLPTPIFEEAAQDFGRKHFYSGSALPPRLQWRIADCPLTGLNCFGKRSTIQTW
jgi:superfamily I DNA/RNA helicase